MALGTQSWLVVSLASSFSFLISCQVHAQLVPPVNPPPPDPLTAGYTFQGVTFRYPSNWAIRQGAGTITVAPPSAFDQGEKRTFVTHGFFMWTSDNVSASLDDITAQILQTLAKNSPRIQADSSSLAHIGDPPWAACGTTFDPSPPYVGSETGRACAYRVGSHVVAMLVFSPTRDWELYRQTFDAIVNTMYSDLTAPLPSATPQIVPLPGTPSRLPPVSGCESGHWIESVGGDGKVIKLEDGSLWNVDDVDTVDTALWLPTTEIVICGSKMIDVDDNETAYVTAIAPAGRQRTSNSGSYSIQAAANDETFVINDSVFKAKTYCFGLDKGDKVIFIKGSPGGSCVSATFLDLKNDKVCEVWCE